MHHTADKQHFVLCILLPGQHHNIIYIQNNNSFNEKREFCLIITFDISVNLPFTVQILQPLQYFSQNSSNVSFFKRSWTELREKRGGGRQTGHGLLLNY